MVDAINGGGKPITNVNEIYVNWKKCTVDQVLKYEKDGREVPSDILKWAEEIAKIADAPEDVTYEATNGSTDVNEVIQKAEGQNQLSVAQTERQQMEDGGTSLYDQGKAFIDKSKEASGENMMMMMSTTKKAGDSESLAAQARMNATFTEMKSKSIKKEYDALVEKAQDQNGQGLSIGEQARLVNLGQQLNKIGTSSQNRLQDMSTQVAALDQTIASYDNTPSNALDYGAETATIGAELLAGKKNETQNNNPKDNVAQTAEKTQTTENNTPQENTQQPDVKTRAASAVQDFKQAKNGVRFMETLFNKEKRMGRRAGEQGISTINIGTKGQEKLDNNKATVEESQNKISTAQKKVGDVTLVKAQTNENNKTETNDETNKDETKTTDKAQDKTVKNQDKTLADPTITADANEILKRKERKGIPL